MPIKDPKELFVRMLSDVRQGAENATKIYQEFSDLAERPEVKEALSARAFVSEKDVATLDQCFKLLGATPAKQPGRLHEVFVEEFRNGLAEIDSKEGRHLYILAKAHQLNHLRLGEYAVMIEAADAMGHFGVGLLLSSCLADKMAFMERTRHLVRKIIMGEAAMKMAA